MKYFAKLINNEKIQISLDNFKQYKNSVNDYIAVDTPKATLYIKFSQILFVYELESDCECCFCK